MSDVEYEKVTSVHPKNKICDPTNRLLMKILFVAVISIALGFVSGLLVFRTSSPQPDRSDKSFEELSRALQEDVNSAFLETQYRIFTSELHQMGSSRNQFLAEEMRRNWTEWGLQSARIFNYTLQATTPPDETDPSVVRLIGNNLIVLNISTTEMNGELPLYHSYSVGGQARGRLVFLNYGLSENLQTLDQLKVAYCGPGVVVVVRLGFSVRSEKVKTLMKKCGTNLPEGMLIYPDPWDFAVDSSNKSSTPDNTPVYPQSWWLPGDAAVFGNMKMKSGLQSPGLPTLKGIFQTINFSEMQTPFPVQPISYDDARALFQYFTKTPVPADWAARCLPKFIASSDKVLIEMVIKNRVSMATVSNVVAWIPGSVDRDRYVILGNHRDAWVSGASDPGSGTVILQQVASILGNAYKTGRFKPLRSVLFASWDGEENGLLGSNEFANQFSTELRDRCFAHVNMDCPIKGLWSFNGRATPLMIGPMLHSARNVRINSSSTLFDDWLQKKPLSPSNTEPKVSFLGGGSDHIPFAYVLGIPSAYPEYRFKQYLPNMPAYHTRYDNLDMMLKWVDPGLEHHQIVAKFVIDYIIRLTSSPLIPFELHRLVDLLVVSFPKLKVALDSIPFVKSANFARILEEQLLQFQNSTVSFQSRSKLDSNLKDGSRLGKMNDILSKLPKMFLTRDGLPNRPYLRNILLSTRLSNSYMGSVFTGVYDSIELFKGGTVDLSVVLRQLSLLSNALRRAVDLLNGGLIDVME